MKTHVRSSRSWFLMFTLLSLPGARPAFAQEPDIPASGTRLWEVQLGSIYASPAITADGTAYIVAGNPDSTLYALTPQGARKWEVLLGLPGASPAIGADGTIYVGANRTFKGYRPNGSLLWSFSFPATQLFYHVSAPAIAHDGTIYVGTGHPDKSLYAFGPDGTLKWKFAAGGAFAEVYAPVVGPDGTIYFGSYNDGFYAVNPDGSRRWYYPMNGYQISAAIGQDGSVYVVGSIFPNKLFAFTPAGVKRWETQIGPELSQGSSAPVIGPDGTIFVGCGYDVKLHAFHADGSAKWSFAAPGLVGGTSSSPAVDSQGNVYAGFGLSFYAVSSSGSRLWSFSTNGLFTAPTLTPDGILYVGSAAGSAYAFQANAGLAQTAWPMFQRDLGHTGAAPAASGTNIPPDRPSVVNIVARDPFASEGTQVGGPDDDANRWAVEAGNPWRVNLGGTNTATFVVRRQGPTAGDLVVHYEISGTASNGVDYAALPGSVAIPAGRHTAQIIVAPIADNRAEGIETVVLQIARSAEYAVGFPSRAAAIIDDDGRPRPPCALLPDHQFHFCRPASNGFTFRVEASSDVRRWISLCTNVVTDGALHFVDPDAMPWPVRYYRAEPEPGLPPDD